MWFIGAMSILLAYWLTRVRLLLSDRGTDEVQDVLVNDLRAVETAARSLFGPELAI